MPAALSERDAQIRGFLRAEPAFQLDGEGRLCGTARVPGMAGRIHSFELMVKVPAGFPQPECAPLVWIVRHDLGKQLTLDAHVFDTGRLCLQVDDSGDIPHETIGLSGFMQHVALHLDRIVIWKHTGRYPGPEVPHGLRGLEGYYRARYPALLHRYLDGEVELPSRQAPCPCASGRRFRRCCRKGLKNAVERLTRFRAVRTPARPAPVIGPSPAGRAR